MDVCIEQYRMVIGLFVRARFGKMTFWINNFGLFIGHSIIANLNIAHYIIVILLIQMCDNDIERNPGPVHHDQNSSTHRDLTNCHLNMQSMKKKEKLKHDELELCSTFDIITVSETWLSVDDSNDNYTLNKYHPLFRRDRGNGRGGGGVAAWVSDKLVARRRNDLDNPEIEAMWIEIRSHNNIFLLCVIYRPPNLPAVFWDNLQDMLNIVKVDRVKILGDFNADNNTRDGVRFNVFTGINHLTSLIDEPTRITAISQTRLDRIVTNIPHLVSKSEVLAPLLQNDHCTISDSLNLRLHRGNTYTRLMYDYSRGDFDGLRDYISNINWSESLGDFTDIEFASTRWSIIILDAAKQGRSQEKEGGGGRI